MATTSYDAIVVGSGITGGWAAKELTEKGLNTLVLEAGRSIVPERDYVEHVPVWELKHRGWDNRGERERTQPIQRECYYACDEYSNQFFVSDKDNPYTFAPGKHFSWIRGRQVGGKSILWGRQSYRWSDLGPFVTRTSRRGTTTWKSSPASAARPKVCRNCPTGNSFRRWK